MSSDFVDILDECLDRLRAGDSIEACLTRYPGYADELEPLLETVHFAQALRATEPPRPEALARERNLFLTEAARLWPQEAALPAAPVRPVQPPQPTLLERIQEFFTVGWPVPAWARAAVVVVAVLLVFGAISGVAVQASETSLPGESLYTLKQLTRQLQLLATLDPVEREEKAKQFQAAERQEVQQATERGRVFREDITGVITDVRGDTLVLEGDLLVTVAPSTLITGELERGHLAILQVRSEGGRLIAENVHVGAGTQSLAALVNTPTPTVAASATPMPTPTQAPTNTATERPTRTPQPTRRATSTREPTKTYTPKPTFTSTLPPTATPGVGFELGVYELAGPIDAIRSGSWVVNGVEILVTSNTIINGEPAVGRRAHVRANRRSDGKLVAVEISVEKADTPEPPEEVQLSGVVEKREGDDVWIIAGTKVRVDGDTHVDGDLKIGAFVDVDGVRESSSTIRALKITVVEVCADPVPFQGRIVSFGSNAWVIEIETIVDGETVLVQYRILIDSDTTIENSPVEGADVQVDTCRIGDEYHARFIYVVPTPTVPPTSTFTPTVPPPVSVTPEPPTNTPTAVTTTPEPPTSTPTVKPSPTNTPVPIPRTPTPTPPTQPGSNGGPPVLVTASPMPGA